LRCSQARETEDRYLDLERLDQSLVAIDSSLRELVRQSRDGMIAQTRLAQQRLEKKLWWAIAVSGGIGMMAAIMALISILRR